MRSLWLAVVSVVLQAALLAPNPAAAQRAIPAAAPAGIVFVGSSIFHRWTALSKQMAPLPFVNRAFDGALTYDMLRLVDSLVTPRPPKVVAYYCGSNDVDAGEPADAIFDHIRQFIVRVRTASPRTTVLFVSINRAPEKQDRWDVVDAVNRRVQAFAAGASGVEYVDVNPALVDRSGAPRLELFMADQLHLRPAAYELFADILRPVLNAAYTAP